MTLPIKVFTMVKNEGDIIEAWIAYHAYLFGYSSLFIIDNYSTEAETLQVLEQYQKKGVSVRQEREYRKKGDYIVKWVKELEKSSGPFLAIPLDIDEFIAKTKRGSSAELKQLVRDLLLLEPEYYRNRYDLTVKDLAEYYYTEGFYRGQRCHGKWLAGVSDEKIAQYLSEHPEIVDIYHTKSKLLSFNVEKEEILETIRSLPEHGRYSFGAQFTTIQNKISYSDPITQLIYYHYDQMGIHAKKFFRSDELTYLDHGNHCGKCKSYKSSECIETGLALLHYHNRGDERTVAKAIADIEGFGYPKDPLELRLMLQENPTLIGEHKIRTYLRYLEKGYTKMSAQRGLLNKSMAILMKELREN